MKSNLDVREGAARLPDERDDRDLLAQDAVREVESLDTVVEDEHPV